MYTIHAHFKGWEIQNCYANKINYIRVDLRLLLKLVNGCIFDHKINIFIRFWRNNNRDTRNLWVFVEILEIGHILYSSLFSFGLNNNRDWFIMHIIDRNLFNWKKNCIQYFLLIALFPKFIIIWSAQTLSLLTFEFYIPYYLPIIIQKLSLRAANCMRSYLICEKPALCNNL